MSPGESVYAWGDQGHQIVCQIAYLLLNTSEQQEIERLTNLYRGTEGVRYRFFTDACTFPDLARTRARDKVPRWGFFSRFDRWHFLNVPRDTREVSESHCAANCVLKGIDYHAARLANKGLDEWKRAEALFFLGHWIGDIHQPLHVSYADDLGGNEIKPIKGSYYEPHHLHYVWDTGIVIKAHGGERWQAYAARLNGRITPALRDQWRVAAPLEWAQESYALTITPEVDYCEWEADDEGGLCRPEAHHRVLHESYQKRFQAEVELRLQKAGVRLTERIRSSLGF